MRCGASVQKRRPWISLRAARPLLLVVPVAAALLAAFITLTPAGRAAARSGLLVPSILPNSALRPLDWLAAEPVREEVSYPDPEGPISAVIHRPGITGRHPAVVLQLGLEPQLADPRVVRLTSGLARGGWVVLLPKLVRLSQHRVGFEEVETLVAAVRFLDHLPYVDPARIGCGGLSVGASLCFIASAQDEVRDQVLFVNFFGGYESAERLIVSVTTGIASHEHSMRVWNPHPEMVAYLFEDS